MKFYIFIFSSETAQCYLSKILRTVKKKHTTETSVFTDIARKNNFNDDDNY